MSNKQPALLLSIPEIAVWPLEGTPGLAALSFIWKDLVGVSPDNPGELLAPDQAAAAVALRQAVAEHARRFQGLDIGSSGAQSVVLMVIVVALTVVQFRFIERRVQYS